MGVYIYRLEPKTKRHPIFGEVGILSYWDKLAWADFQEVDKQERRIAAHNKKWEGRLPKFVVFRYDKKVTDKVYDFSGNKMAIWYDTENLPPAPTPD